MTELEEEDQLGDFHDVWLIKTDVSEAAAVIEAESEAIQWLDAKAENPLEFDEWADQIEYEQPDVPSDEAPDFFSSPQAWHGVEGLELGVAGISYALNSIGAITAASCRSHAASHRKWSEYPVVLFAIGAGRARLLRPLAERTQCGFEISADRPQFLVLYAASVTELMSLARQIIDNAAAFAPLPPHSI
ncbi:hypothetical protein [Microbacterium sp. 22242]|uniref:hypothetical protein n=1 Tax=Microbacterium sp. 22242 TaxID=3453896 RepID=UPI003F83FF3C